MCSTKWGTWLRRVTRQDSSRNIAKKVGVSHTTVLRWIDRGVPPPTAWNLTIRFRGDPIETLVLLGWIGVEDIPVLNFDAIMQYAPEPSMTGELHSRALTTIHQHPGARLQKVVAELEAYTA